MKIYNGFSAAQRRRALRWLRTTGARRPRRPCDLCQAEVADLHSEDYSEPFGDHIGAYSLCPRCHRGVHCRAHYQEAWQRLRAGAAEVGRLPVAEAIERGDAFPPNVTTG